MKKLSLLTVLFLFLFSSSLFAKIHYVSNQGSPDGNGSLTNPFNKISMAYAAAVSNGQNEVIKLMPGNYYEITNLVFDYENISISGYGDGSIIQDNIIVKSDMSFADLHINSGSFSNEAFVIFNNVKCDDSSIDVETISGTWRDNNDKIHINFLIEPVDEMEAVNLESMNTYVQGSITTFVDESELTDETWVENYITDNTVSIDGSEMEGLLTLSGNPTNPMHAATKQYVDEKNADSPLYDAIIGFNEPDLYSAFTNGAKTIFVPEGVHTSAFPAPIILTGETRIKGAGKGISKLYVELTGGEMLFRLNSGFKEVLFEDVDIIITNKSTTSYFIMFYNQYRPDTYAAYRFRNCYFKMYDNGTPSQTHVVKLDNYDKNELEMFNVDADITANTHAFLISAGYNRDREISLIIWDSVVNITAGRTQANSLAGICLIEGRSKSSIIDMRNVVCNISGNVNPASSALYISKNSLPSNIKKCVMNNVIMNTPNTCIEIRSDIDMFRSSDCNFNGPKGILFRGTTYPQYVTNAIISSTSFKCSDVCIDFDDETVGRSDPVIIDNCKFTGTPTNSGCMTRLLWGNNEVNGTFQITEGQTNDWNGEILHNIGEPVVSNDAATMFYVDSQVEGVSTTIVVETRIDDTITRDSELISATNDIVTYTQQNFIKESGDTMTGFLTLPEDPTNFLHAATKGYIDSYFPTLSSLENQITQRVDRAGDTMTGKLTVPSFAITGTNDWLIGNDSAAPVNIVIMSEDGEIKGLYDLKLRAQNGEIILNSPVKFNAGINEADRAGTTNNVVTSGSGFSISVQSCTKDSIVLITSTTNTCPNTFWVEPENGEFTVKSGSGETWSFNYLVR